MPTYTVHGLDEIRVIEAPSKNAVILHVAKDLFEVRLVTIETVEIAARVPAEPVQLAQRESVVGPPRRRGRPPKAEPPPETPRPSETLLSAEAARVAPKTGLFERMSALARESQTEIAAEPKGEAKSPAGSDTLGGEGEARHPGSASPEDQQDEQPARPEPMFE